MAAVTAGRFSSPCASECHMSACEVWVAKGGVLYANNNNNNHNHNTNHIPQHQPYLFVFHILRHYYICVCWVPNFFGSRVLWPASLVALRPEADGDAAE